MNDNTLKSGSSLQDGKYFIQRVLGQGGFGITYEAEQVSLGRRVAVKEFFMKDICNRDENTSHVSVPSVGSKDLVSKFKDKFIREAKMIAGLDHDHIVKIHDVFEENGTAYYVMEYLGGGSLGDGIKSGKALPELEAVGYIRQVADALDYLHSQNILHFDVKPSNILLGRNGSAKLIDFGISKHYDESGVQTSSTPIGISKGFAPLEQYQQGSDLKSFTPATDIYSLGATLYALLSGSNPPEASVVYEDGLPIIADVSQNVMQTIEKAMQPRRKDRAQSVGEFLKLLAAPFVSVQPGVSSNKEPEDIEDKEPKDNDNEGDSEETVLPEAGVKVKDNGEDRGQAQDEETKFHKEDGTAVSGEQAEKQNPGESNGSKSKRFPKWLLGVLAGIVVAAVLALLLINRPGKSSSPSSSSAPSDSIASTTGTHAGHGWVDLGLSVKWATCNVGASSPEGYGSYFAWGETSTKSEYTWPNLKYRTKGDSWDNVKFSKYVAESKYGPVDGKTTLELSDDAARANWGGSWRMPTKNEFQELIDNCTWSWTQMNGKNGYKVVSKSNGNSIFLPAAGWRDDASLYNAGGYGFYWSSSLDESYSFGARYLFFYSGDHITNGLDRSHGQSVRPVFR